MAEEHVQILKMLKDKKISVEEAERRIREEIRSEDDQRLIGEYMERIAVKKPD